MLASAHAHLSARPLSVVLLLLGSGMGARAARLESERRHHHGRTYVRDGRAQGAATCVVEETRTPTKYGIHASYPVPNCLKCKWNVFLGETLPQQIVAEPALSKDETTCKCYYNPKFYDSGRPAQFWFPFKHSKFTTCSKEGCENAWSLWANFAYLKKRLYPGNEVFPNSEHIEGQNNYQLTCDPQAAAHGLLPLGVTLPPPGGKVHELRTEIANAQSEADKKKLEDILADILVDSSVEIYSYDTSDTAEWEEVLCSEAVEVCDLLAGLEASEVDPSTVVDPSVVDTFVSFEMKPCVLEGSTKRITDPAEKLELCGEPELSTSFRPGKVLDRFEFDTSHADEWGPEFACEGTDCEALADEIKHHGKLLSLRLKPCKSTAGKETTTLRETLELCQKTGDPVRVNSIGASWIPIKVSVASLYDPNVSDDDLICEGVKDGQ